MFSCVSVSFAVARWQCRRRVFIDTMFCLWLDRVTSDGKKKKKKKNLEDEVEEEDCSTYYRR